MTTFNGKVCIPKELQQRIVKWDHSNLQHAGIMRTINSIGQTFAWKGLCTMVEKHMKTCDNCQCNINTNKKAYGKILLTSALRNKNQWETVHLDCCGPWTIRYHNKDTRKILTFKIHLLSIAKACTGWNEFSQIKTASLIVTATAFDKNCLCRYP